MGRLLFSSLEEKFSKPRKTDFHLVFSEEIKQSPSLELHHPGTKFLLTYLS